MYYKDGSLNIKMLHLWPITLQSSCKRSFRYLEIKFQVSPNFTKKKSYPVTGRGGL
jgi:hypothetical protein